MSISLSLACLSGLLLSAGEFLSGVVDLSRVGGGEFCLACLFLYCMGGLCLLVGGGEYCESDLDLEGVLSLLYDLEGALSLLCDFALPFLCFFLLRLGCSSCEELSLELDEGLLCLFLSFLARLFCFFDLRRSLTCFSRIFAFFCSFACAIESSGSVLSDELELLVDGLGSLLFDFFLELA